MLRPGAMFTDFNKEVGKGMESGVIKLKLLDKHMFKSRIQKSHCIKNTLCTAHLII